MIKSLKDLLDKFSRFTNSLVYDGGICKRLVNIKNKLKTRLLSIKEKTFTIDFTKEEFRVLKILSNQYLMKKNLKKPKSNINNDFDKYLDKKNK